MTDYGRLTRRAVLRSAGALALGAAPCRAGRRRG